VGPSRLGSEKCMFWHPSVPIALRGGKQVSRLPKKLRPFGPGGLVISEICRTIKRSLGGPLFLGYFGTTRGGP